MARALVWLSSSAILLATAHAGGRASASALSPDGRMLAYAVKDALMLLRLDPDYSPTAPAAVLARERREIAEVDWMPDGKQILYLVWRDSPHLRRIALSPGSRPQTITAPDIQLRDVQMTADRRTFATQTTQVSELWRAEVDVTPPKAAAAPAGARSHPQMRVVLPAFFLFLLGVEPPKACPIAIRLAP